MEREKAFRLSIIDYFIDEKSATWDFRLLLSFTRVEAADKSEVHSSTWDSCCR